MLPTVIVDDIYKKYLETRSWFISKSKYVLEVGTCIPLHVIVFLRAGIQIDGEIDHRNRDRLDNRLCNLRLCTHAQNIRNRGIPRHNTSGFLGVSFHKASGRWRGHVQLNGKQYSAGYYATAPAAAVARDILVSKLHGEFAVLNGEI